MRLLTPVIWAASAALVSADVLFTTPAAGASVAAGSLHIEWKDSGVAPALSTFTTYTIELWAGGADSTTQAAITTLIPGGSFTTGSVQIATVNPSLAGTLTNAYFLRITSTSSQGGTVINFSDRFTITGMTGTFAPAIITGVNALGGSTKGPATINNVANNVAAPAPAPGTVLPYSLQTGLTRYAPMQSVPPTKITAKSATPLYPTSAFTIATTFLAPPQAQTTITLQQTFSQASVENTAAPASQPTGYNAASAAVKRWLERWQDE